MIFIIIITVIVSFLPTAAAAAKTAAREQSCNILQDLATNDILVQ